VNDIALLIVILLLAFSGTVLEYAMTDKKSDDQT
jgi:cytochrome c biogenesis protein ResB